MDAFLLAQSDRDGLDAVSAHLLSQFGEVPAEANLGFLYFSAHHTPHLPQLLAQLRKETGVEHWVGTVGMGIIASGTEYYDQPAIAALIGEFPEDSFRIFHANVRGMQPLIDEHGDWMDQDSFHLGVIHGDPRNMATQELIRELAGTVPGAFLVGGISSSENEDLPQLCDGIQSHAVSGVLFNSQVGVSTALSQGCSPISEPVEVTEAMKNILVTLGNRPALDVAKEAMGEMLARDINRAAGYIFAGLPVAGSDTRDYLVRNLVGVDPDQGLVAIADHVKTGQSIMFCRRDGQTARDDLQHMLEDIHKRVGDRPIKGGLYISCLGRGQHMFGKPGAELTLLKEHLGDVPLVGFYANGEISHNRLYGFTGVLTIFH